jgi:hypothetical protein
VAKRAIGDVRIQKRIHLRSSAGAGGRGGTFSLYHERFRGSAGDRDRIRQCEMSSISISLPINGLNALRAHSHTITKRPPPLRELAPETCQQESEMGRSEDIEFQDDRDPERTGAGIRSKA